VELLSLDCTYSRVMRPSRMAIETQDLKRASRVRVAQSGRASTARHFPSPLRRAPRRALRPQQASQPRLRKSTLSHRGPFLCRALRSLHKPLPLRGQSDDMSSGLCVRVKLPTTLSAVQVYGHVQLTLQLHDLAA